MKKAEIFFVVIISLFFCLIFYWKLVFVNKILFPGDLLVGAYFPWLEYKWGYLVGVPIKNTLISDIFSQFFTWKSLIAESFINGNWPLWNPYSYSGYPFLANFNSGALNPFNIFMILFGDVNGWNFLLASQTFGSFIAFYLFMRAMKLSKEASIVAALTYSFSGFAITWLPFVNVGYSFIWIALIFFCIEKYFENKKYRFLLIISPLSFLLMSAGHFQALVFGFLLFSFYFAFRLFPNYRNYKAISIFVLSVLYGVAMMSIQLLPTFELMHRSVRFAENYISGYDFGLLPLTHIIRFWAPDFFGNVATNNYWSAFNYHETVIYVGIYGLISIIGSIYDFKKLGKFKFFLITLLISIGFIFNTFFGRSIYENSVPLISTSAAGRIAFVIVFSVAALSGLWYEKLAKLSFKSFIRIYWWFPLSFAIIFSLSFAIYKIYLPHAELIPFEIQKAKTAWRNVIFPFGISTLFLFVILLFRKSKLFIFLISLIICIDLFRFGWKYLPFVDKQFVYPDTPVTNYLKDQSGVFRVDREKAQILPPNTWTDYRLQSPSGYDPMAVSEYVGFYNRFLNEASLDFVSRYSELNFYDAKKLGQVNVKYLLALKRNSENEVSQNGEALAIRIDEKDWNKIFETEWVVILENKFFEQRVSLESGTSEIVKYSPNEVIVNYFANDKGSLTLLDTNYPGWKAYVNGDETKIYDYKEVYRKVNIPKGSGSVTFKYQPESFYFGLKITTMAFLAWIMLYRFTKQ